MNDKQKAKRKFRASKAWKDFREEKKQEQGGLDPITGTKLTKTSNLHHRRLDLDETDYEDISDKENFVFLLHDCHKVLHWCLRYVKKYHDMSVVERLVDEVRQEAEMNGYLQRT